MELVKLILNLAVIILPLIFSKDSYYDERIKTINKLLAKKRSEFERMTDDEKSIELSNLVDDLNRIFELHR